MVIDTREQDALFTNWLELDKCPKALKDGDYSIKGFEHLFSIERKRGEEFFSYIGKERTKTVRKLRRLSEMEFAAVVIEESFDDLLSPRLYTSLKPQHAIGFLKSLNVKYGVHFFCHRDRRQIEYYILDRAIYYYKLKRGIK